MLRSFAGGCCKRLCASAGTRIFLATVALFPGPCRFSWCSCVCRCCASAQKSQDNTKQRNWSRSGQQIASSGTAIDGKPRLKFKSFINLLSRPDRRVLPVQAEGGSTAQGIALQVPGRAFGVAATRSSGGSDGSSMTAAAYSISAAAALCVRACVRARVRPCVCACMYDVCVSRYPYPEK